jgi:hypothetical protein
MTKWCQQAPYEPLGSFKVPDWFNVNNGRDFVGVGFDASLEHDESE